MPVAIDPAAAVARMARVMIRFAFIESSMTKSRGQEPKTGELDGPHDALVVSSYNRSTAFLLGAKRKATVTFCLDACLLMKLA
jgi:hypothetical protein